MAAEGVEKLNVNVKSLVDGMKNNFQKAADTIGGHVQDVMSEEMKMSVDALKSGFASLKGAGETTVDFLRNGFVWEKTVAEKNQKKQTKSLLAIEDMMKFEMKKKLLAGKAVGKGFLKGLFALIGVPIVALGAAIGGIMAVILKPFQVIKKLIAPILFIAKLGLVKTIIALSTKFPMFLKGIRILGKVGTWFGKLLRLPGINLFVKGFAWGFKKLFWPLQLIISAIDFVKGFQATEGDLLEKIKGGIKNVIVKFFEFPAKILGSAWDWLLNKLGIISADEMGGSSDKILKGIGIVIDKFFDTYKIIFGGISAGIEILFGKLREVKWEETFDNMKKWILWFVGIPRRLTDKVTSWLPNWLKPDTEVDKPPIISPMGVATDEANQAMYGGVAESYKKAEERKVLMEESNMIGKQQVKQLGLLEKAIMSITGIPLTYPIQQGDTGGRSIREGIGFGGSDIAEMAAGDHD